MRLLCPWYGKLTIALLLTLCALGLIFLGVTRYATELYQQEANQKLNRDLAAHIVKQKLLMQDGAVNQAALTDIFKMLMTINPSIELYLVDFSGRILAFSAPADRVLRDRIDLEPVHAFLHGAAALPLLGDDPRDPAARKIFSAAPIGTQGYLYIILASEKYAGIAQVVQGSYVFRGTLAVIVVALVLSFVAGALVFARLTRRLRGLTKAVAKFKQGDFSDGELLPTLCAGAPADEIDRFASTVKEMASRIAEQFEALRQTDTTRRELVANISHDLRTPLSSLRGYLETLQLKGDTLPREERERYLAVAIKNSERLGELISEFFELAKLECREVRPVYASFSITDLAEQVVQKFELAAQKRGIAVRAHIMSELPPVYADSGMIERVLVNLIDNALRFTPAGGSVTVSISKARDRVSVSVADTGCGIAPAALPDVLSGRRSALVAQTPDSSGLGLTIAKRILALHNSEIGVISAADVGTLFSFSLAIADEFASVERTPGANECETPVNCG